MTTSIRRMAPILVVLLALVAALAPTWAHAADADPAGPRTWAVVPASASGPDGRGTFDYIVTPDDVYPDHAAVRNFGDEPLTVTLSAQDAVQTVDNDFELLTSEDRAAQIGAWLELDSTEVTVPPRSSVVVPFRITVPDDAAPGDHAGGIVAVSQPTEGDGATVQYRVGSRIHLRVAGAVDAALDVDALHGRYETRLAPFASAPLDLDATLENTGNVRLAPSAEVKVTGLFGWWSTSRPLDGITEILPDGAQSGAARVADVPAIGPLWVTVEVPAVSSAGQDVTELTEVTTITVVVWAMPWVLLAASALLLTALIVALVNLRRRRRERALALSPASAS